VIADGVRLGSKATVVCEEVVAIGDGSWFRDDFEIRCRRAYLGAGIHGGARVRFGGGGHRDPWATLVVGDLAFVGDEVFVNVCRPVLIGREVFLTMRALIVTHNIGHSVLEGFENRFAPVVLENRSQVGLGAIVYAGSRVGAEAIVASGSYVVGDIPAGSFAIGVPAKVTGSASHRLSEGRQLELARRMIDDLHELMALLGHSVSAIEGDDPRGFEVKGARVLFTPSYRGGVGGPAVVLTLDVRGGVPDGVAVLDLLGRHVHGSGGVVLESVREFCRKRGIRFEPGPWRYRGGLV
jgi:acetyltransferase-like isoleucine patch superfamily enzyme